ncbi:hypothetical protein ACS0VI_22345 [Streptomyces sp. H28]|uniref:hypothetical protein n=1 Tax=Streptomyces sp. H28 TaxID=2775865 RepID=UPI001CE096BB|nr:hypothetical protein [Streptomyces sp. H28]
MARFACLGREAGGEQKSSTTVETDAGSATVQAANYLRVSPNTSSSPLAPNIEIGLYAERTGKTVSTYGPRWSELTTSGGRTQAKWDNRFSVRRIDGKDNLKGGERLAAMYTLNRILDGDAFYMKITGQWRAAAPWHS